MSRFFRPQEWKEDQVGHVAEQCLLRLLIRLGLKVEKATDYEDCHFGVDLWIPYRGHNIPVQLTCESDQGRRDRKAGKAWQRKVAFVHLQFVELTQSLRYETAAKRVMDQLRQQLDEYLHFAGAPTLTRGKCYQAEGRFVAQHGNTFQPRRRSA